MSAPDRPWTVYLLRCADGSLYCGVTTDLDRRIREHNSGSWAKYTRSRTPVALAARAEFADRATACRVEFAVKQRPAQDKLNFLARMHLDCGLPAPPAAEQ